jgi:hypothetical protein
MVACLTVIPAVTAKKARKKYIAWLYIYKPVVLIWQDGYELPFHFLHYKRKNSKMQ